MKIHRYHRGEFTAGEVEASEDEDWENILERLGFSRHLQNQLGDEYDG